MAFDLVSTLVGFFVGAATGAVGSYFANKYTDRRHEKEAGRYAKQQFRAIRKQMPQLIAEMKSDLAGDGNAHVREFFVLPNERLQAEAVEFVPTQDGLDDIRCEAGQTQHPPSRRLRRTGPTDVGAINAQGLGQILDGGVVA